MAKKEKNIIRGRLVRSYFLSVVTISIVLLLMGIFALLGVNAKAVADYFKESMIVSVMLKVNVGDAEATDFYKQIESQPFVKSAEYISREKGMDQIKELLGNDFYDTFGVNSIPISIELKLNSSYLNNDGLSDVKALLEKEAIVEEVTYQQSLVELLNSNIKKIGGVLLIVIVLLLLISSVLISNTVRLNIYSKRFTINTMRLVGATKSFIRKPFIGRSFFQGLLSSLLAVLSIAIILYVIQNKFGRLFAIFDPELLIAVLAAIVVVGVLICVISTYRAVNKMVTMTKDELYY